LLGSQLQRQKTPCWLHACSLTTTTTAFLLICGCFAIWVRPCDSSFAARCAGDVVDGSPSSRGSSAASSQQAWAQAEFGQWFDRLYHICLQEVEQEATSLLRAKSGELPPLAAAAAAPAGAIVSGS
jgi:hypothetical protein